MSAIIHPTAIVDPAAQLGEGVEIGPFSIIGPKVKLGDRVRLMSHVTPCLVQGSAGGCQPSLQVCTHPSTPLVLL